jgi:hypothetical protein
VRWEQLPINTTFDRARRKEIYRRLSDVVRRTHGDDLLPLDDLRDRFRLFEQTYVGVMPIPVSRIVGTAGHTEDFDKDFLPRRPDVAERWMRLERAFPDGEFPPIVVYQVGDSYFVVDGHHRVALARQKGIEYIDAEVTRLKARFELPEGIDVGRMILAEQQHLFMERSGLERARPEAAIDLSRPLGYVELVEIIEVHAYHLCLDHGRVVPIEAAAGDFYDKIYMPTIDAIKREGLERVIDNRTEADLFLWVYERRRSLFAEHGELGLEDVVRHEKEHHQNRPSSIRRARRRQRDSPATRDLL